MCASPEALASEETQNNKNAAEDGGAKWSIADSFEKDVSKWIENTPAEKRSTSPGYFRIGTTSETLKSIGIRDGNIYWRKYKIGEILEDHPEITTGIILQAPQILEKPIVVMKSCTVDNSIVLFGDVKAENGRKVLAAVELTPKSGGNTEAQFSLLTSVHGRTDANIHNLLKNSEVLYLDNEKRTLTWLMQLGVQFPSRQPALGPIGKITYESGSVNIVGEKLSNLGAVFSKPNNDGQFSRADVSPEELQKKLRESERARRKAEKLKAKAVEQAEYWRNQARVRPEKRMKAEDVRKFARDILKEYSYSSVKADELYRRLLILARHFTAGGKKNMTDLYDEAYYIAQEIIDSSYARLNENGEIVPATGKNDRATEVNE